MIKMINQLKKIVKILDKGVSRVVYLRQEIQ